LAQATRCSRRMAQLLTWPQVHAGTPTAQPQSQQQQQQQYGTGSDASLLTLPALNPPLICSVVTDVNSTCPSIPGRDQDSSRASPLFQEETLSAESHGIQQSRPVSARSLSGKGRPPTGETNPTPGRTGTVGQLFPKAMCSGSSLSPAPQATTVSSKLSRTGNLLPSHTAGSPRRTSRSKQRRDRSSVAVSSPPASSPPLLASRNLRPSNASGSPRRTSTRSKSKQRIRNSLTEDGHPSHATGSSRQARSKQKRSSTPSSLPASSSPVSASRTSAVTLPASRPASRAGSAQQSGSRRSSTNSDDVATDQIAEGRAPSMTPPGQKRWNSKLGPAPFPSLIFMMGGANLEPQEVENFMTGLFCQYSSKFDKYGAPLMQKHELQDFLEGFTGMPHDPAIKSVVSKFCEKIAQQKETASETGLSLQESEQGLCLASFAELLIETSQRLPPETMSSIIAGRYYLCGGNAAILAQSMRRAQDGRLPSKTRRWLPICR